MSPLPRGFKTWTERLSAGIRRDLGLTGTAPLPAKQLAEYLDVRLWTPHDVQDLPSEVLDQLLRHDPEGWSAVTEEIGDDVIVIYNPTHSIGRQSSDIAHELAHVLLDHEPGRIIMSADGNVVLRSYDAKQEEEANWLAWTLLLPRVALVAARRDQKTIQEIGHEYGVSTTLVTFRLRKCGVDTQIHASRALRKKPSR
jgi:uncharacterized protein DUF955